MKLTDLERRLVAALVKGPKTPAQLLTLSGTASPDTLRVHLSRIRQKLPQGNITTVTRYVLTDDAKAALTDVLWSPDA